MIPFSVEVFEVSVVFLRVHFIESLVEEEVKFVTAVVVAASFAWAFFLADSILEFQGFRVTAAALGIKRVAAASEDGVSSFISS